MRLPSVPCSRSKRSSRSPMRPAGPPGPAPPPPAGCPSFPALRGPGLEAPGPAAQLLPLGLDGVHGAVVAVLELLDPFALQPVADVVLVDAEGGQVAPEPMGPVHAL